nr:MAG TPA: hypothetical protein [Caudoviricetes sp.]
MVEFDHFRTSLIQHFRLLSSRTEAFFVLFYDNRLIVISAPLKNTNSLFIVCIFDFGNQIVSG